MRSLSTLLLPFSMKMCIVPLLLVLQLSLETCSIVAATTVGGNKTDHDALLEFKAKIMHDPQNVMRSWNDSVHFCNWEGITCGRRHKRVTILDLHSKGLVGSLSPYIGNISFLREILLYNNTLQGEIPQDLGHLSRLKVLFLANNTFEGQIPSNLSRCSNLIRLRLGYNQLTGKIPVELTTLSKLKGLTIHCNYLSGDIPSFLGNLSSLEILSAANNLFGGTVPDALGQLKYLSIIALSGNNLSGTIPLDVYNVSSITIFSVSYNSLHGSLPSNIGLLLPHLEILQLSENHFSGSIPVSLSNASKLEYIYLLKNNFTGKLDVDFGSLDQLFRLHLQNNNLGSNKGDNDLDFMTSLLNCSNLKEVQLSFNHFRGALPNFVANSNLSSSSLQMITIAYNQIHGGLPPWFPTLVSLSWFDMQVNQITGSIPKEIGKLSRLQRLFLNNNRLKGPIPSSIGNLSLLTGLQLNDNNLQGTIPSSLGNCHNLLFINVSNNSLSGSIPKQIFAIHSMLVGLYLSHNRLEGSLPSEIGNLFSLKEFLVSQNKLSGKIPNDLSRCNSLEYLDLSENNFQGIIPPSLASLRGLRQFDLSKNNFSGNIPQYLETFALEYLDLSSNDFGGKIPIKGVFANASTVWVQGNNKLCGGIPELKLPRCITEVSKKSKLYHFRIVIIIVSCIFGVTLLSTSLYCWFRKKKRYQPAASLQLKSFQKLSYQMILKATDEFSLENLIGVGSFGSVYKGIFDVDNGAVIAVKVLNLQRRGASKSFEAECKALRNIRHRNLVRIITSCSSIDFQGNDFKALIYEFMSNGNLEIWLYPNSQMEHPSLSFLQRLNIVIDVGNAIDYLHHNCGKPIIHCDLKPSNILLDNDMVAHVGDFGLAKFLPRLTNSMENSSIGVRGTIGYTAPEYGLGSEVSTNGDVYSYGILLLEMITRKKPTDEVFVEGLNLHTFARMALQNGGLEIVDPILLQEDCKIECIISMIKIGIECSMESPQDRMDISNAVNELTSIRNNYVPSRIYNHRCIQEHKVENVK